MKRARFWVGIGISLICLGLALRGVEWGRVWQYLREARYSYLMAAVLIFVAGLGARAFRWQLLFFPRRDLSRMRLFAISNIGYLLINILPARVGDLARAYLVSRGGQVSAAYALSTIVVERIYDTLSAVLMLALISPFIPLPSWAAQGGLIVGAAILVLAAFLFVLGTQRERLLDLWRWAAERIPWLARLGLEGTIPSALEGLAVLRNPKVALGVLGWSGAVWACNFGPFYLVMRALSLDLPWGAAAFTLSVTALSMIIPSSPGYVGVFEEGVILSLGLFAAKRETALAYGLLIHTLNYVTVNLLGLIGLWQESCGAWCVKRGAKPGLRSTLYALRSTRQCSTNHKE
ncbi:MAG: lysylphosphatidylglycerol synthase transmembrane domain-containing protein [Chloroflexota bacterium]|nr:lysylphosphatidylglycerol synthase transmembrane domain-containing protein [Chloroflexota bacterium]